MDITWVSHGHHMNITWVSHVHNSLPSPSHISSSLPSVQSITPLQRCRMEIQSPLVQAYSPSRQPWCIIYRMQSSHHTQILA